MFCKSTRPALCTLAALWLATFMISFAVAPAEGYAHTIDCDVIVAY